MYAANKLHIKDMTKSTLHVVLVTDTCTILTYVVTYEV